jgi:predicted RNA-binding protein with PUA-like domain
VSAPSCFLRSVKHHLSSITHKGSAIATNYWLMKSEPEDCSVDDALAAPRATVPWTGVRNYQARNFMRDRMKIGDGVLFCHSGVEQPGIVGLAEVASAPYPDPTQFDPKSGYFDPGSKAESPRWVMVDVRVLRKTKLVTLIELRSHRELADMRVLQKGNRLSITPVSAGEWRFIQKLLSR